MFGNWFKSDPIWIHCDKNGAKRSELPKSSVDELIKFSDGEWSEDDGTVTLLSNVSVRFKRHKFYFWSGESFRKKE